MFLNVVNHPTRLKQQALVLYLPDPRPLVSTRVPDDFITTWLAQFVWIFILYVYMEPS